LRSITRMISHSFGRVAAVIQTHGTIREFSHQVLAPDACWAWCAIITMGYNLGIFARRLTFARRIPALRPGHSGLPGLKPPPTPRSPPGPRCLPVNIERNRSQQILVLISVSSCSPGPDRADHGKADFASNERSIFLATVPLHTKRVDQHVAFLSHAKSPTVA